MMVRRARRTQSYISNFSAINGTHRFLSRPTASVTARPFQIRICRYAFIAIRFDRAICDRGRNDRGGRRMISEDWKSARLRYLGSMSNIKSDKVGIKKKKIIPTFVRRRLNATRIASRGATRDRSSSQFLTATTKKIRQRRGIFRGSQKARTGREAEVPPDQMARAAICMRPLAPGVPGFAYERVALTDFSLPSGISSLSPSRF